MSEPENVLKRWSKRKLATGDAVAVQEEIPPQATKDKDAVAPELEAGESPAPAENRPLDLSSLPPIESIGANTDVSAFLRPGVPAELTRAALRRAWSTDPAIRDFVGLVENGWDFNDPQAMPGFGPIGSGDVARLVSQVIGNSQAAAAGAPAEPQEHAAPRSGKAPPELPPEQSSADHDPPEPTYVQRSIENDAARKDSDSGS